MSIKWKLVIMYIALVLIVMIASGTLIITALRITEERNVENGLRQAANKIKDNIIDVMPENEFQEGFESWTSEDGTILGQETQGNILDANGRTIASSVVSTEYNFYPVYNQNIIAIALMGTEKEIFQAGARHPDINLKDTIWMEYCRPIFDENDPKTVEYIIYVRQDGAGTYAGIANTTTIIALSIAFAMVLSGVLGILFSSTLTGPIRLLTSKSKELAAGNLNQEIKVESKDEIGQLTESFNNMAVELNRSIKDIENEKNKLEIVLYNMTDGVLAYDSNGQIIHANQVSKELLGNKKNIEKMTLVEIAELLDYPSDISIMESGAQNRETTITIGDKYINASFNPYQDKGGRLEGVVVVLQDITKHKKLDDMRKEFVANVSHELRTPLTTIKSYTETMIDGVVQDEETTLKFLNIINGEADCMTLIVRDLLELSSLDNNQLSLNLRDCSLKELIRQTVKQQSITAEKQKKQILLEEPESDMIVNIDQARIRQVLLNIISNSVKYSMKNAVINIYTDENENYYRVYVKDNGMGIPKEDLRRIFERFYRVDKARSRAMGGTGLGLSIAKEIMEAHGGRITASSELGKGTTMILRFPKNAKGDSIQEW